MMEQIVVLDVSAFSPQDAQTIASALVGITEEFADQMNQRARSDALQVAESQVTEAEKRAKESRLDMARWRDATGIVDPTADVTMINELISQMETQLTAKSNALADIDASGAKDSPNRRLVLNSIQTLKERISETRKRLGGDSSAAANQIIQYEALKAGQEYAESNLASARQTLDFARQASIRQQKYVALIAEPIAGRRPTYPAPVVSLLGAAIVGVGLTFLGALIFSLARSSIVA